MGWHDGLLGSGLAEVCVAEVAGASDTNIATAPVAVCWASASAVAIIAGCDIDILLRF